MVINIPDNMVTKVLQKVINTDILIIMAHSNSPEVRTYVIKVRPQKRECLHHTTGTMINLLRENRYYIKEKNINRLI